MGQLVAFAVQGQLVTWTNVLLAIHITVQFVISVRVLLSRRSVGETIAWILVVFFVPGLGSLFYLLVGELRLGSRRAKQLEQLELPIRKRLKALDRDSLRVNWHDLDEVSEQLAIAGQNLMGVPALPGNGLELLSDWQQVFDRMIADIDNSQVHCDFEFYIWDSGGRADDVVEAIVRACQRGVVCRILIDALGSRKFLRSAAAERLRQAGAQVVSALPDDFWRLLFIRYDLRMHRKIVLVDDRIAYTGSLNIVDPRFFKQHSGVGQWIDSMVRIEGPAVESLAITFQTDWNLETGASETELPDLSDEFAVFKKGDAVIQAWPSGPAKSTDTIEHLMILAIYAARKELVITTPYFVPSEALQIALRSAAERGVRVVIVLPAEVDSFFVRYASRSFADDLLACGVLIAKFKGGLLHTKSVTIDEKISLFGSLNFDRRSLCLNFEITLAIYGKAFAKQLRALQQSYVDQSVLMDPLVAKNRTLLSRLFQNLLRLFSPLL